MAMKRRVKDKQQTEEDEDMEEESEDEEEDEDPEEEIPEPKSPPPQIDITENEIIDMIEGHCNRIVNLIRTLRK